MKDIRKNVVIYDLESYRSLFFLCTFEATRSSPNVEYTKVPNSDKTFMIHDWKEFRLYQRETKDSHMWTGFNNRGYDDLMLILFAQGGQTNESMRALNDGIIVGGKGTKKPNGNYYIDDNKCIRMSNKNKQELFIPNLVCDMSQISGEGSLKMKSIILNTDSIMESPVSFNDEVPDDMISEVVKYCATDLDQTFTLLKFHEFDLQIRDNFYEQFPNIAYSVNTPKLGDEYFKANTKQFKERKRSLSGTKTQLKKFLMNKDIEFTNKYMIEWFEKFKQAKVIVANNHEFVGEKGTTFSDESLREIDLHLPQHQFTFGLGGLHSSNKCGFWVCEPTEVIYNVDVSSYYPSMEIEYDINPKSIPSYSKVKKQLKDMREEYKELLRETGDSKYKVQEQGVKLIGNSTFGKLNDKYAYLYDLEALYSVTITGQVLLLKLADMIIESGVKMEMIQANTDGLFYKIDTYDIPKMDEISRKWEKLTGVMLDREFFSNWFQQSCNNYFASNVSEETPTKVNYIKSKGSFLLKPDITKKLPIPKIVKLACIKYLTEGIDPTQTIGTSKDVTDFIFSANSTDFKAGGEVIGYKAIRVVYSTTGKEFKALKNDKENGGFKEQIVAEGEKLKFLIKLSDHTVESLDLNYNKYIFSAWQMIYSVIKPRNDGDNAYYVPQMSDEVNWFHIKGAIEQLYSNGLLAEWYDYLDQFGLSLIPKNVCKKNYKGVRIRDRETWKKIDPRKALGLGVVCDTVCSIDIDNPANLDPTLRNLLLKFPTMKVYHGEDNVLEGGKGAFIYKTTEPLKLRSSAKMVENLGFEFLNDEGKVQTLMGVHPKGDMYQVEGEPVELPKAIKDYLLGAKTPEGRRAIGRITGKKKAVVERVLEVDENLVYSMLRDEGIELRNSKMIDNNLHCWDYEEHWFVISRCEATGKHYASTNHSNFKTTLDYIFK